MTMTYSRALATLTAVLLLCTPLGAAVATAGEVAGTLGDLTIEELMNVEITSVSKKEEPLLHATSAIYVITGEDIRRSGVTSIPEALRMAPGIEVARINGNRWAISARGFNGEFANKLLVLMDGRTVYDLAFSGVYWDVQDTMLEDIDRIEVIRGPGATLWGANAVNGVINIITKHAADTQGLLLTAGGGTQEIGFGSARYGGTFGTRVQYRLYAKYFDRGAQAPALGLSPSDGWDVGRGGFRLEWEPSPAGTVTLQGDWYRGGEDETLVERQLTPPLQAPEVAHAHVDGRNLLARGHYVFGDRSDATVQAYYDHTTRRDDDLGENTDTVDLSLEHHVGLGVHDVVWGLGYRSVSDAFDDTFEAGLRPAARRYDIFNGFVQDQVPLVADRLRFTVGTKLEHNAFSGFEVQPSASLVWTPHPRHAAWLAVARAVRTPARTDRDLRFVFSAFPTENGTPALLVAEGNRDFKSEKLVSYELVMLSAGLIAFVLSSRLQRIISEPIGALVETASTISTRHDYSLRVPDRHRDEIGVLIKSFNEMLSQIEQRDHALVKAQDELEDRVEERTAELRDEIAEREQAQAEAESATRAKSAFLANMSHEIRTPINVIIGMTDMALDGELPVESRDYLNTVRRATLGLLAIVNDILDSSKIAAGKVTMEAVDVSLRSVVAEVDELLAPQARAKGLALECAVDADIPQHVRGDPNRLKQVLVNLTANAIKFTETGGVTVGFRVLERSATQVRVRGAVHDTGIGIPADRRAAIFESFTQADNSTTRTYGGTGLGLTISRQLVELMGGRIGVESEVGQGSTFWFEITLALAADDEARSRARSAYA